MPDMMDGYSAHGRRRTSTLAKTGGNDADRHQTDAASSASQQGHPRPWLAAAPAGQRIIAQHAR
jgi:hypothetical protein